MNSQPSILRREPTTASLWRDFRRWALRNSLSNKLTVFVLVLAVASSVATYIALTAAASPLNKNPHTIYWLLNFNMVILIVLGGMIIRRVVTLWLGSRRGLAGARLHVQLVRTFSFVAIVPAIVMAIFAVVFFSSVVDSWFGDRVRIAVTESLAVAHAYLEEHQQNIKADALAMSVDLNREADNAMADPRFMNELLRTQSLLRNLTEAMVFTYHGEIIGRSGLTFSMEFENIPFGAMKQADAGEVVLQTNDKGDRVRALIKLNNYPDAYLYVGRLVEEKVLNHIDTAQRASEDYLALQSKRSHVQFIFAITFVMVALLLTLVAVWIGLWFANKLAAPISRLITAAEKVRAGDLSYRINDMNPMDELATLQRAFNRMTSQLENQRDDLLKANTLLDERRLFTESVLTGVSAGVMAVDEVGIVTIANQVSYHLLDGDPAGISLRDISVEMEALRLKLLASDQKLLQSELQWGAQNEMKAASKTFLVRVSRDLSAPHSLQTIVTLDDITLLQSAQRIAAWSDVARRIAHEIKNPLTPIQLSAERLKRRYLKQIEDDPATFEACIDTIVRQVGDIESMITEFSSFARMKEPKKQKEDLGELCRQSIVLQESARSDIKFQLSISKDPVFILCDRQQINQVLTNLLQNAVDAIDGREGDDVDKTVSVTVEQYTQVAHLIIEDNGKGFPENKDRLLEPYVTTRTRGTGLGLAIVKKILDDHDATLALSDRQDNQGARIEITLPVWHSANLQPA